jgi:hypothetical protein
MHHWLNTVPPVTSALAAIAACFSAYFSKRSVDEARRIATDQIKTAKTTARANSLASRIAFYNEQLENAKANLQQLGSPGRVLTEAGQAAVVRTQDSVTELGYQRDHLGWQLDRELDDLGVGLRRTSPGSPHNDRVVGWSKVPSEAGPLPPIEVDVLDSER